MNQADLILICAALAAITAILSWFMAFWSRALAERYRAIDQPTGGRKIHAKPTPLFGGVGILAAFICALAFAIRCGILFAPTLAPRQVFGVILAFIILLVGGMIDDRKNLSPWMQLVFPSIAAIVIIATGTGIIQITQPFGHGALSLVWWQGSVTLDGLKLGVSFPSDILTFVWLLAATYATKLLDGMDGLVAGLTVIGSALIGSLSLTSAYLLPPVAILSSIFGGAYLGFLPHNLPPAKQFLGESGSLIAGFGLGVLAILSGAKIAVALAVLAIPLTDLVVVVIGRLRRGEPWYRGDRSHIHHRLLDAGLGVRRSLVLLWCVALVAGIAVLSLQTRGKLFLIGGLIVATIGISFLASWHAKRNPRP